MATVHNVYKYHSSHLNYLYFCVENQMTHFSCNIPYTAQVYSGKPREGQYSRHHNIKEGNETKFKYQQTNSEQLANVQASNRNAQF